MQYKLVLGSNFDMFFFFLTRLLYWSLYGPAGLLFWLLCSLHIIISLISVSKKQKKQNPLPLRVTWPKAPHALFARRYLFSSFSISFYLRLGFLIFAPSSLSLALPLADSFTRFFPKLCPCRYFLNSAVYQKLKKKSSLLSSLLLRERERRLKTVYWDKE